MYDIYKYGYKTDVKLTKEGYTLTLTKSAKDNAGGES
jgi:hypothetical protein